MEMLWTIVAFAFVFGVFTPLVLGLLVLPFVLLALVLMLERRPRAG